MMLRNKRVNLSLLEPAHLEQLLPFALNEPDLWRYGLVSAAGAAGMQAYIEAALRDHSLGNAIPFLVFDLEKQAVAGSTRFYDIVPLHQTASIGYTWIGKDFQRSGLNTHMKYVMIQAAFEQMGLKRLEWRADTRNHQSIGAMRRLGLTEEGVLREHLNLHNGDRRSSIIFSLLASEWEGGVRQHLEALL